MQPPTWLLVTLSVLAVLAATTTVWSVSWDMKAYRVWQRVQSERQPRHKRRQRQRRREDEDEDAKRWHWIIRALQIAAAGFLLGVSGIVAGFLARVTWPIVVGGNLLVVGVIAWIAYQLVLPKPTALRQKRLPGWLASRQSTSKGGETS